jgi:hypothetical protein
MGPARGLLGTGTDMNISAIREVPENALYDMTHETVRTPLSAGLNDDVS